MSLELLLGGLLAAAVVVFVALPLLGSDPMPPLESQEAEAIAAEERDRALAELRELEFDHRTGKITDEDYRVLVQPLRQQAARTLGNGAALSDMAAEESSEQQFSESSGSSSRSGR